MPGMAAPRCKCTEGHGPPWIFLALPHALVSAPPAFFSDQHSPPVHSIIRGGPQC